MKAADDSGSITPGEVEEVKVDLLPPEKKSLRPKKEVTAADMEVTSKAQMLVSNMPTYDPIYFEKPGTKGLNMME